MVRLYEEIKQFEESLSGPPSVKKPKLCQRPSIVLIGMRGVGKSTLGLIASAALKYDLIDLNRGVYENIDANESQIHLKQVLLDFKENEFKLIVDCFEKNPQACVLILPATCVDYKPTLEYLVEKGAVHPIIHIGCEESRILSYVSFDGLLDVGLTWIRKRYKAYQYCSRFDYFNIHSESKSSLSYPGHSSAVDVLALKQAENSFLKFLSLTLYGTWESQCYLPLPEYASSSSAVQIDYPEALDKHVNFKEAILGSDAVNININFQLFLELRIPSRSLSEFISAVRQETAQKYPIIVLIDYDLLNAPANPSRELKQLYVELLLLSIRSGVQYLTLNIQLTQETGFFTKIEGYEIIKQLVDNSYRTKLIADICITDNKEFWSTSAPFDALTLAKNLGFKIVIITKSATRFEENLEVQQFLKDCSKLGDGSVKVSAYNTGSLGIFSRILSPFLTRSEPIFSLNPEDVKRIIHHKQSHHENESKLIQKLSSPALNRSLFSCYMLPELKFFVIGRHVEKSLSPQMHNAAYAALGLPHQCVIYQCFELSDIEQVMKRDDFGGACVIMPFKKDVIQLVDECSEHVRRIGALNTIYTLRSKTDSSKIVSIRGDNTDWIGIRNIITANTSPINGASKDRSALVIGAGGMARASLYALISMGVSEIYLHNRTQQSAYDLAKHFMDQSPLHFTQPFPRDVDFKIIVIKDLENMSDLESFIQPTVIVNCLPATDYDTGKPVDLKIPDFWFDSALGGVFVDIAYEQLISPFLIQARRHSHRGWVATNGLSYLHAQAVPQFEMHTGKLAPEKLMKNVLMSSFAAYC